MKFGYTYVVKFLVIFLQSNSFKNYTLTLWPNKIIEWRVHIANLQIKRVLSMQLNNSNKKFHNSDETLF